MPLTGAEYFLGVMVTATAREGSAEYESSNTGFQIGYDLATTENDFGTVVYGATIQYNSMEVDVSAFNVAGTYTAKGFGIGGTATVYMKDGTYVDTQLQHNQVSADFEWVTVLERY